MAAPLPERSGAPCSRTAMVIAEASTRWLRRAVVLVDQALSSVSNLLAVVLVARVLTPAEFGYFSLGYAILTLTLGLSRAYFGSRISLAPDVEEARRITSALVAGMLVLSPLVVLVVLAGATAATGGQAPLIALVVALATPVVCIQDALRFGAVAGGRPWVALVSDALWILVMAVPFVLSSQLSAPAALTLWGSAAGAALLVALLGFGERPRLRAGLSELRRREAVGSALTLGAVATTAATLLVLLAVSRALGPAAAGSLRGASTAMGPVNVLFAFTAVGLTPVLVQRERRGDRRFCARVGAMTVGLVLLWGLVLLLLPERLGAAAFGESYLGIRSVLAWTVGEYVWIAVAAAAVLGLKVRQGASGLIVTRIGTATLTVLAGTAAALFVGHVQAVAAAFVLSAAAGAVTAWWLLLRPTPRTFPGLTGRAGEGAERVTCG
jgi:O-antigen/teichoic acid export membrane protein